VAPLIRYISLLLMFGFFAISSGGIIARKSFQNTLIACF
jgi:hypothetical protein